MKNAQFVLLLIKKCKSMTGCKPSSSERSPTGLNERRRGHKVCDENGENDEFLPFEKPY